MNTHNQDQEHDEEMDYSQKALNKQYGKSESFLWRWVYYFIVFLIIAIVVYLAIKHYDELKSVSSNNTTPQLGPNQLELQSPTMSGIDTDVQKLFRM
jgi:large-conductance mechanosensitive channel